MATLGWKTSQHVLIKPFPHTPPLTVLNSPLASLVQTTTLSYGCCDPLGKEKLWAPFSPTKKAVLLKDSLLRSAQSAGPPGMGSDNSPRGSARSQHLKWMKWEPTGLDNGSQPWEENTDKQEFLLVFLQKANTRLYGWYCEGSSVDDDDEVVSLACLRW